MSLDQAHDTLGWPSREEILHPTGVGATVFAKLLEEKLAKAISRRPDGQGVRIGVLASNPDSTEAPLAIVCDFPKKVSEETLRETQKLAWNFGRSSLLITIEPLIIRTWTCCEPPTESGAVTLFNSPEIEPAIELDEQTGTFLSEQAAMSLHWVELLTGEFFRQHEDRFKPEKRADQMLLNNLKDVRQRLIEAGLSDDIGHDLLARIIFIQFLFDRKDTEGKAALNEEELQRLHFEEGLLSQAYRSIGEILSNYDDAYALFRWLNSQFNGDLFPGKGTQEEQETAWAAERQYVRPDHLNLLARFVNGTEQMKDGQLSLWPYYAFDAIPLEFISTIYEEFVKKDTKTGVHYTPSHVADLVLDSVLPWQGQEWDLKVLDPSCGSGVFLVKAFQRLIYRWKAAHPDQQIGGEMLGRLLDENLFGVDLDAHAVRVASFSLYLAMCDQIDPRDYWKQVHFPVLRGRRLVSADFFSEDYQGFRTSDGPIYDIVIGNPPWGKNTATLLAREWKAKADWPISNGDIGPLFLAKTMALTKPNGYIGLLEPASALLYNHTSPAKEFRERIFDEAQVEEIINFADLRHVLFRKSIVPVCAVVLRNCPPNGEAFWYSCPKRLHTQEDKHRIIIEPQDVHEIFPQEVKSDPWIWSTLLWGGRRDLVFVNRLKHYPNLASLEAKGILTSRRGITRSRNLRYEQAIVHRPMLEARDFPQDNELVIRRAEVGINQNPYVDSRASTDYSAFEWPQLVIKQSFTKAQRRFRAALIESDLPTGGVICSDSYLSVHADVEKQAYLEAACAGFNSQLAVYYLLLTSGRFAMDRNEPQEEAFRRTPLPEARLNLLEGIQTVNQVDERIRTAFAFKEAEWLLIEDLVQFTLPDYKGGSDSPGRQPTCRRFADGTEEPELRKYCDTFRRVLQAAYGDNKYIGAIIHSEPIEQKTLPVRMVSIYLNLPTVTATQIELITSVTLQERLTKLYQTMLSTEENRHSFYQRCARTYDPIPSPSGQSAIRINLIMPDQVRYWTRSMALRDADTVVADIMIWNRTSGQLQRDHEVAVIA